MAEPGRQAGHALQRARHERARQARPAWLPVATSAPRQRGHDLHRMQCTIDVMQCMKLLLTRTQHMPLSARFKQLLCREGVYGTLGCKKVFAPRRTPRNTCRTRRTRTGESTMTVSDAVVMV